MSVALQSFLRFLPGITLLDSVNNRTNPRRSYLEKNKPKKGEVQAFVRLVSFIGLEKNKERMGELYKSTGCPRDYCVSKISSGQHEIENHRQAQTALNCAPVP